MYAIKHHLSTFIRELKKDSPLRVTSEGEFYVENGIQKLIRNIFQLKFSRLMDAAKVFTGILEDLESIPVRFSSGKNVECAQEVDFLLYIRAGELLVQKLICYFDKKSFDTRFKLERALIALRYRLEGVNGGLDADYPHQELFAQLVHAATVWKCTQQIYTEKRLSSQEIQQLREASRYPFFAKIILQDAELANAFFQWALRDRIAIRPFVEYPCQHFAINRSALNGRLARFGGSDLKIQKLQCADCYEKQLTLPIEGRPVNILDKEKQVVFRGDLVLSIGEIFSVFENKRVESGCLEYMADGIINWSAHRWGYWNAKKNQYEQIDFTKPKWWNQLPVLDHLSLKQVRKKFGNHLSGAEWNIALVSARVSQDLDFENSHAYVSLAVPQGDGSYIVYSMGKCTFVFPESFVKALFKVGETCEATIAYPDENVFYTHRRKTRFSYAVSAGEGERYFESVKRDMLLSNEGNFIYQIETENCAKWVYEKLIDAVGKHRVPDIYKMPFLKSEPHGILRKVFDFIHSLPVKWQIPVTTFIHLMLGACKGRFIIEKGKLVWKSLTFHSFWEDTVIFHPSMLYKQQEDGNLFRFVSAGVTLVDRITHSVVVKNIHIFFKKFNRLKQDACIFFKKKKSALFHSCKRIMQNNCFIQNLLSR